MGSLGGRVDEWRTPGTGGPGIAKVMERSFVPLSWGPQDGGDYVAIVRLDPEPAGGLCGHLHPSLPWGPETAEAMQPFSVFPILGTCLFSYQKKKGFLPQRPPGIHQGTPQAAKCAGTPGRHKPRNTTAQNTLTSSHPLWIGQQQACKRQVMKCSTD